MVSRHRFKFQQRGKPTLCQLTFHYMPVKFKRVTRHWLGKAVSFFEQEWACVPFVSHVIYGDSEMEWGENKHLRELYSVYSTDSSSSQINLLTLKRSLMYIVTTIWSRDSYTLVLIDWDSVQSIHLFFFNLTIAVLCIETMTWTPLTTGCSIMNAHINILTILSLVGSRDNIHCLTSPEI